MCYTFKIGGVHQCWCYRHVLVCWFVGVCIEYVVEISFRKLYDISPKTKSYKCDNNNWHQVTKAKTKQKHTNLQLDYYVPFTRISRQLGLIFGTDIQPYMLQMRATVETEPKKIIIAIYIHWCVYYINCMYIWTKTLRIWLMCCDHTWVQMELYKLTKHFKLFWNFSLKTNIEANIQRDCISKCQDESWTKIEREERKKNRKRFNLMRLRMQTSVLNSSYYLMRMSELRAHKLNEHFMY